MYHKVAPLNPAAKLASHYVDPKLFERQMRLLRTLKYEVVDLPSLTTPSASKRLAITFDDGYRNFYEHALPHLLAHGLKSTVFVVSNQIGGTNLWDVEQGDAEERLMSRVELLSAQERGVKFGSHTADHADLSKVSYAQAKHQIFDSKSDLEEILGTSVPTFCYPYGKMGRSTPQLVKEAGYHLACSTDKGANDSKTDRFALKRINIRRETTLPLFMYKLWRSVTLGK